MNETVNVRRLIRLIANAIIETGGPKCSTPSWCIMQHKSNCRVARWNAIMEMLEIESEYQCPKCGYWGNEDSLIKRSKPEYNYRKALEFGGNPMDWVETHECPNCKTIWEFDNSNC